MPAGGAVAAACRAASLPSLDPKCPYSALYVVATLPKIKTQASWNAVQNIYTAAWLKLLPPGEPPQRAPLEMRWSAASYRAGRGAAGSPAGGTDSQWKWNAHPPAGP